MPTNKRLTDKLGKYFISGTSFDSITSYVGGALYLDHPQLFEIQQCTFSNLRALNRTNQTDLNGGIAGAIYYTCSGDDPDCEVAIENTNFTNNFAQVMGGAIHYDYYEPVFGSGVNFVNNKAGWYGDSISSYSQQLKPITLYEYSQMIQKINFPLSYKDFLAMTTAAQQPAPPK